MAGRGAYGQNLADCFRIGSAQSFVSRTVQHSEIAVTRIVCDVENNGLTAPIPREDALLVTVQLRDCAAHELWLDGKAMHTGPLAAGTVSIYDLRRAPVVNSISPFRNLHFYLPRRALESVIVDDLAIVDDISHNPGVGMQDPIVHGLARALVPAFDDPDEVTTLFADHVTTAVAAYVARLFGQAGAPPVRGGLTRWQAQRAKELLRARLDGAVTIADLANECGVPRHAFSDAFRRSIGLMPHQWLSRQRIENARELLTSSVSLAEVATLCGFKSERQMVCELRKHAIHIRGPAWRRRAGDRQAPSD